MSDLNVYTTAEINALTPITGDLVVDSDLNAVKLYNGSAWKTFTTDGVSTPPYQNRWGASFDGSNDYLTANESNLATSGDCTISLWFNSASLPVSSGFGYMFSLTDGRATGTDRAVGMRGTGSDAQIIANTYASGWNLPFTNTSISADTWYHVAVVFTSGSAQVYFNGADKGSKTVSTNTISYNQTVIGGLLYSSANHFNGKIDEVSVFHSALSSTDITAIYNSGVPADISSLSPVGYWRMGDDSNDSASDGGSIATITDSSGNGNDATQGTASSQPTFKALDQSTTSLSFDGSNDYLDLGSSTTYADTGSAFSISAWFKFDTFSNYPAILQLKTNRSNGFLLAAGAVSTYQGVWFGSSDADGFKGLSTSSSSVASSISSGWHHLIFTYDGVDSQSSSSFNLYIDGSAVTATAAVGIGAYSNVNKSGHGDFSYFGFDGLIDDLAIFNTELSSSDVTSIYNSGTPADISSLSPVGWWKMGDDDSLTHGASASQITDASGNGNHATQSTAANQPTANSTSTIYV
jgi:hypothetical protein